MNRDELIAALEKAEGPSRELDAHLSLILNDGWQYDAPGFIWQPGCGSINSQRLPVRRYTESIDAALTLVPDTIKDMTLDWRNGYSWKADLFQPSREFRAHARSPAIAICIAALKARGGA